MRFAVRVSVVVLLMMAEMSGYSQGRSASPPHQLSDSLEAYLQSYLSLGGRIPPDPATRVNIFSVKSCADKTNEYIVYVSGGGWCGSGGCRMLILEPTGSSFRVLGNVTIVQLPIRLLTSMNYGHPDIGVMVQGGGILSGYEAVLSFDGKKYPSNPTMPPARRVTAFEGKVVMASTDGSVLLYH